jgi:putative transposase
VIKYRKRVLNDDISQTLKQHFIRIMSSYQITLDEWNHDFDHIHILFHSVPNINLSKVINSYKSASSRQIKIEYPEIKKQLWKETFWSKSYCLLTTGGTTIDTIKQYIEDQRRE